MPVDFEWGDVNEDNTKPGDTVVYITSPERGHWGLGRTYYSIVQVLAFEAFGAHIRYRTGAEADVTCNHLFTIESRTTKKVEIIEGKRHRRVLGLIDSIRVGRDEKGDYQTLIKDVETGKEEILGSFTGQGKMKKARELAQKIKAENPV